MTSLCLCLCLCLSFCVACILLRSSYCASSCPELTCIGVLTSDDERLEEVSDHGVRFQMPSNSTGFRD
eukprot:COSAG03_NODE_8308_length_815_cov_1.074022_1_plen_67_part_01